MAANKTSFKPGNKAGKAGNTGGIRLGHRLNESKELNSIAKEIKKALFDFIKGKLSDSSELTALWADKVHKIELLKLAGRLLPFDEAPPVANLTITLKPDNTSQEELIFKFDNKEEKEENTSEDTMSRELE